MNRRNQGNTDMGKRERTTELKKQVNPIKSELLRILGAMEREGLARDANILGNIIARLEDWQHR
jgi:DNA polymerase I-like protein with 3'-5' exonuclease and polymerase domains